MYERVSHVCTNYSVNAAIGLPCRTMSFQVSILLSITNLYCIRLARSSCLFQRVRVAWFCYIGSAFHPIFPSRSLGSGRKILVPVAFLAFPILVVIARYPADLGTQNLGLVHELLLVIEVESSCAVQGATACKI
jgi:hypothetical protein